MDVEFILSAVRSGDVTSILEINNSLLKDTKVYKSVLDHYAKFGVMPSENTIVSDTGIKQRGDLEPPGYYLEKIYERAKMDRLKSINNQIRKAYEKDSDIDKLIDQIRSDVIEIDLLKTNDEGFIDVIETIERRKQEYKELKELEGTLGLSSPWEQLDEITLGWCPGTINLFVGPSSIGKTWLLVKQFEHSFRSGDRPLMVSVELIAQTIMRRIDATYAKLSYSDLRKGELDMQSEDKYINSLDEMKSSGNKGWIVDASRVSSVYEMELMFNKLKPKIILLDGIYLFRSNMRNAKLWENLTAIMRSIQLFCNRTKVPFLGTLQFSKEVKKGSKKGDQTNIGGSHSFFQAADVFIKMEQDEYDMNSGQMNLEIMKGREFAFKKGIVINWDDIPRDFKFLSYIEEDDQQYKFQDNPIDINF